MAFGVGQIGALGGVRRRAAVVAAQSSAITLPATVWAFGASSMAGAQTATSGSNTGPEDSLTNVVRAIEGLPPGSLAYTTVGGSQLIRPIDYILTGVNAGKFVRNRGVGGQTSGTAGTIVSTMAAAEGSFGASDFLVLHQGDNGLSPTAVGTVEALVAGYASMRTLADTNTYVQITNTQGGYNYNSATASPEPPGAAWGYIKATALRILNDLNPGRAFSFYETLMERSTGLDANDLIDRSNGISLRSCMMNDGSHMIGKGYNLQSDAVLTPLVDAWAGGTPFPLKQIVETVAPAIPAAGDAIGSIVAYGSGGTFSLDTSNTQTDYAVSSSGAITRIGATPPTRDITWAAVKTSKAGRFDKAQPLIGICERAAPGVSRMVEFDGASVLGMPDCKLSNSAKMTLLVRLQQTATGTQNVFGGMLTSTQCLVRILTAGTVDVVWRNASGITVYSDTTLANFRAIDPPRWLAVCIDLTGPAVGINKMVTWVDPASPAVTRVKDAAGADVCRLSSTAAFGASTASLSTGSAMGQFRIGDFTLFNDYIDFSVLARRQEVANSDGTPKSAWVLGGGVTNGITPLLYMGGNAGDWRQGRLRGSAIPASPGATGQYMAYNNRERSAGVPGFLVTV